MTRGVPVIGRFRGADTRAPGRCPFEPLLNLLACYSPGTHTHPEGASPMATRRRPINRVTTATRRARRMLTGSARGPASVERRVALAVAARTGGRV